VLRKNGKIEYASIRDFGDFREQEGSFRPVERPRRPSGGNPKTLPSREAEDEKRKGEIWGAL